MADARSLLVRSACFRRDGSCGRRAASTAGRRAFDILALWSTRAGEVTSKEERSPELGRRLSSKEANLKKFRQRLRRAIGDGQGGQRYIVTVFGTWLQFVAGHLQGAAAGSLSPRGAPNIAA